MLLLGGQAKEITVLMNAMKARHVAGSWSNESVAFYEPNQNPWYICLIEVWPLTELLG